MPTTRRQQSRRLTLRNLATKLDLLNQVEIQHFWNHKFVIRQFLLTNTNRPVWTPNRLQLFTTLLRTFLHVTDNAIVALQHFRTIVQNTINALDETP